MYKIKFPNGKIKEFDSLVNANLVEADLRGVDLSNVDLRGANLWRADLRNTNLTKAKFRGAILIDANLNGAIFYETGLNGAVLEGTCIKTFMLGKHFGFYYQDRVCIGCADYPLNYWLEEIEQIAKNEGYTENEMVLYKAQLNLLKEFC